MKQQSISKANIFTQHKKHIVRSLNHYSRFFDTIYFHKYISVIDGKFGYFKFESKNPADENNIVYSKDETRNNLQNYSLLMEELKHLERGINPAYLKELKTFIKDVTILNKQSANSQEEWQTFFFDENHKDEVIEHLNKYIFKNKRANSLTKTYAHKVYNQLKNRIQYKRVGIFYNFSNAQQEAREFEITTINKFDILKEKIKYVRNNFWIFDKIIINDLKEFIQKKEQIEKQQFEEEIYLEPFDNIIRYYDIELLETDDPIYIDAVENLIEEYYYREYEIENISKGKNPYKREHIYFSNEAAIWNEEQCKEYINRYNEENHDRYPDKIYDVSKKYERNYSHPVDENELKKDKNINSKSSEEQWYELNSILYSGIESSNPNNNRFYLVKKYVDEIINTVETLKQGNVFTNKGGINLYSSYFNKYKSDLLKSMLEYSDENEKQLTKKQVKRYLDSAIVSIKKQWLHMLETSTQTEFFLLSHYDFTGLIKATQEPQPKKEPPKKIEVQTELFNHQSYNPNSDPDYNPDDDPFL